MATRTKATKRRSAASPKAPAAATPRNPIRAAMDAGLVSMEEAVDYVAVVMRTMGDVLMGVPVTPADIAAAEYRAMVKELRPAEGSRAAARKKLGGVGK